MKLPPVDSIPETVASPTTPRFPEIVAEVIDKSLLRFKVTLLPNDTSPPPERLVPAVTVTLELDKAELGMLVKVLSLPDMLLLVSVCVALVRTTVPVACGNVI